LILSLRATYSSKNEKLLMIKKVDEKIFILKTLIRLAKEIKSLNIKKYIILEKELQEIGRMIGGWIRSIK